MTPIRATGGLELPRHVREAGRTLAYSLLGVAYGVVYIVVVGGGLILGAILSPAWVGLPLMAKVARLAWNLAEGERRQANRLLEAHLPPVPRPPRTRLARHARADRLRSVLARVRDAHAQAAVLARRAGAGRGCRSRWSRSCSCSPARASPARPNRVVGPWTLGARHSRSRCACWRRRSACSPWPRRTASAGCCGPSPRRCCAPSARERSRCARCWPSASATAR